MLVTIMRHGEAVYRALSDAERPLTERGRAEVHLGARQLLAHCRSAGLAPPDTLLHSPYRRTTETASIVGGELSLTPVVLKELAPGYAPAEIEKAQEVSHSDADGHILLVSHQPLVSLLVMRWCALDTPRHSLNPGGFTTLATEIILPGMASHCFSALPPTYGVLA